MHVRKSSAAIWIISLASALAFQSSSPTAIRLHAAVRPPSSFVTSKQPIAAAAAASALRAASTDDRDAATIQILMSDTGGGHRASANALRDAFNVLHETDPARFPLPIICDIVDIYTDYGPWPYNMYVPAYKIMAEYSFLWKWFYETGATPLGLWLYDLVLELICFGPFKECMTRDPANVDGRGGRRADMVVSVHPLCQDLPLKILTSLDTGGASRKEGRETPFVTVVTDLGGAHPSWFNSGVDRCFVPSDVLRNAALDRNVEASKIVQYGLPIRRGFWRFGSDSDIPGGAIVERTNARAEMDRSAIRERLGLSDLPTVLIVGGGDGMGGIVSQAMAVGERLQRLASSSSSSSSYQMVVVCGNNKSAQTALSPPQMKWGGDIDVRVQGFVNNMDDFMRASDILVTKAGPGTIAEASICGLPCILSSFLPGQEEGNVPYVVDNGFGCYQGSPEGIADTVEEWFASTRAEGSMLERMRDNALIAARPDATLDIAKDLADMLYARREELKKGEKAPAVVAVAA